MRSIGTRRTTVTLARPDPIRLTETSSAADLVRVLIELTAVLERVVDRVNELSAQPAP